MLCLRRPYRPSSVSNVQLRSLAIKEIVERAAKVLPHQAILENFVHHNPLEQFQHLPFKQAVSHVQKLESSVSPGERLNQLLHLDPRKRANEALVVLSSSFLDRSAAKWAPSYRDKGFLYFFATHEGFGPQWRRFARQAASDLLTKESSDSAAEEYIKDYLDFFAIHPDYHEDAIRASLQELRGWAGMFHRMETHPEEAPLGAAVRLLDFCAVQAILARSSIDDMCQGAGWDARLLFGEWLSQKRLYRPDSTYSRHPSSIAYVDQQNGRREQLETEYQRHLLKQVDGNQPASASVPSRPKIQVFTCIDDREGSYRRHLEDLGPDVETFGVAGFFGLPVQFAPANGLDKMTLAPEGQRPSAVLAERHPLDLARSYQARAKLAASVNYWWERASFSPLLSFGQSLIFLPVSLTRHLLLGLLPRAKYRLENTAHSLLVPTVPTDFAAPHSDEEAARLLAQTFNDVGLRNQFAPVVLVFGHGSSSVNNPFEAAYQCGACGGRPGGPNARLLARYANNTHIRETLRAQYNIDIPNDTIFVGGLRDTTKDAVQYFDVDSLSEDEKLRFSFARRLIEQANGENALERCQRFLLADGVDTPSEALQHVSRRATEAAEIRPELNHAGNAAVIVGRRSLTKGCFLDRRAFLCSYDPKTDDERGTNLEHVLAPALAVCSGINLEYLFSTVQPDHQGAGTKVPLNMVGNIGVLQGTLGDLRPGLPSQMTEMHTPIRALYLVDAPVSRVEAVLSRRSNLRDLVHNEWVRDPESGVFYQMAEGQFFPVDKAEFRDDNPKLPASESEDNFDAFTETQYGQALSETPSQVTAATMRQALFRFAGHRRHGLSIAESESLIYWSSLAGLGLACGVPIYSFAGEAMNPWGVQIAMAGTLLSLPVLGFSRRYMHGEFLYGRFSALSVSLLAGFNTVAMAPNLEVALPAWSLFGFSSAFLIGSYNSRPTVRNNATFAFAAYKLSDMALLTAATFAPHMDADPRVAAGLIVAAVLKSSQWPLIGLFARSMEGPTPASALGYAGLSAHIGMVLLTGTMPLWMGFDWARLALGSVGTVSALYGTLAANIRPDRKGAVANATSATIGVGFVSLALGYPDVALLMSLGHAAFRMRQILLSSNTLAETRDMRAGLRSSPWPTVVPDWLYRLSWRVRRLDDDWNSAFVHWVAQLSRPAHLHQPRQWTRPKRWLATGTAVTLAGAPYTPVSHAFEGLLSELLHTHPLLAGSLMTAHFGASLVILRFLLMDVLQPPSQK